MIKQSKMLSFLLMLLATKLSLAVPNDWRKDLPEPILDQHPDWVKMYYATWQMADKKKMKHGGEFIFDTAFDAGRVWLWDTVWISHFGIYTQGANPDVTKPMFGHDLFYSAQKEDGAIPHVFSSKKRKHEYTMHNPIFTLGELNYYRHTGDKSRLKWVLPILDKFYFNLKKRFAHPERLIYRSFDWNNGLDNRPMGHYTIDSTAEQLMVAKQLVQISKLVGDKKRADKFRKEFEELEAAINKEMWSEKDQFYVDLGKDFKQENHWSVASYWAFLAGLPNKKHANAMVKHLFDPENFKTPFMVPTLGRKSKGYDETGGNYWCGAVWIPTNTMVVKGLAQYGFHKEAFDIAVSGLNGICETWKDTKTFWENYDQERLGNRGENSRKDFIGWTGVQPITLLIENVIGVSTNAPKNSIDWHIQLSEKHGIKKLKWGENYSKEVDLVATPSPETDEFILTIKTSSPFKLQVFHDGIRHHFDIHKAGNRTFRIKTSQKFTSKTKRGLYFNKKKYTPEPLPTFEQVKSQLPSPILEDNKEWQDMYWKCWQIALSKLRTPEPNSPMVSNWMDEAFSGNIFQWDTIFMMMFARYGHSQFPAIQSLDNFYALQRPSGYICREYREIDGKEIHFDHANEIAPMGLFSPTGWRNTINPPLFSWAELESFKVSGDKSRFEAVLPVLEKYVEWLNRDGDPDDHENWENNGRRSATAPHKLYWNTPLGSGLDNTPKPTKKGAGWVDMSCQMVIQYNNLATICTELGKVKKAKLFAAEAKKIANRINKWCWNEEDGIYYDVLADGAHFKKKTALAFWPMIAGIASKEQAEKLVKHLKNPAEFWRPIVFPTLSADEKEYHEYGGYWLGGVWAPTNYAIIKGLERYGYNDFAAEATEKYLSGMATVFKKTGTVWENYAPEHMVPGRPAKGDFVGWTGCGPIALLIENVLGFHPNGVSNRLDWFLYRTDRHGIEHLQFGDINATLICEKRSGRDASAKIFIDSNKAFVLTLHNGNKKRVLSVPLGKSSFTF